MGVAKKKSTKTKATAATKKKELASSLIDRTIETFQKKLITEEIKPTVGDLIRLLQFQQESEAEEPREIIVKWVEPAETESSTET